MNERLAILAKVRRDIGDDRARARGDLAGRRWSFIPRFGRASSPAAIAKASIDPVGTPSAMREIGRTGLRQYSGYIDEEFLTVLKGRKAIEVWREMSLNDSTVGAMLFAIRMMIRQVKWRVEPGGDDPADVEKAHHLSECIDDMAETWADLIAEVLSFVEMGFSLHEPVFKKRQGASRDPSKDSKFNDGRIGWQKIPGRAQETIDRWLFDDDTGELNGCEQVALPSLDRVTIPSSRFLLFRTTTAKGNPEGQSVLRTAYRSWYFKRRIEEIEGIGIERDLAGLPVAGAPAELFASDADPADAAILEEIRQIVTNIRRDEQDGVVLPLEYDEKGNKKYTLELLTTGGRRQFDTTQIIDRWDKRIAQTVLADVILMGQGAVGSHALADSKTELLAAALGAWLDGIEQMFNRQAIPQLFRLNTFPDTEKLPELKHGDVETADIVRLADYVSKLVTAGALNGVDDEDLENYLRAQANLPKRPEGLEIKDDPPPMPPMPMPDPEPDPEPDPAEGDPDPEPDEGAEA